MPTRAKQNKTKPTSRAGDALGLFEPWVAEWFRAYLGIPTSPQSMAWPLISRGDHVLVHAPTGSGKTLAAFLWSLNSLYSGDATVAARTAKHDASARSGVQVLYISPLKALNNDVERNLRVPLAGIRDTADRKGVDLPDIRVAVRTGDTPPSERAAMVRKPPHILITTPESLYLLLTSPKAREILSSVTTCIVDEIHTMCSEKRGVHLALSLERLERLSPGFQRIGLSATQRPLEEVARFLGGQSVTSGPGGLNTTARPVSIVDAPYEKQIQLEVIGMPEQAGSEFAGSVWPGLIPRLLEDVRQHKTTLIFCNSRRQAERTADRMNTQWALEQPGAVEDESENEWKLQAGFLGGGSTDGPFRAHHSSVSEEVRRDLERDLKAGRLPALVGTSSLELGIDIGSVDLVVQLQAPKSVTQGLQRVGRSGHNVGDISRGRFYPLHAEDLVESAAVVRGMLDCDIETVRTPRNALDVLAQQVVAIVSTDTPAGAPDQDWPLTDLYRLIRGAH